MGIDQVVAAPPMPPAGTLGAFFWAGARDGRLLIQRCSACGTFIHLPRPVCRACRSFDLAPTEVCGRGTVYSFTETYKAFHPFFVDRVPFLLATVELEEQVGLMVLSNLVGAAEPDVRIGMDVVVDFEVLSPELTIPVFRPAAAGVGVSSGRSVAIVGVGYSDVGRHSGLSERHHAAQAAVRALEDAGLDAADIDGASTLGGDAGDFAWMLGMGPLTWHLNFGITPAFVAPAIQAAMAVGAGACETAIAFRLMMQQPTSAAAAAGNAAIAVANLEDTEFQFPFGDFSPTQWAGLLMNRYLHDSDATEEHFARFAVAQRDYAMRNDEALQRAPLSVDDYLSSPYISKPLRLLDCDYPCDSGSAVIFTTEERARDLRQPVVLVDAMALSSAHDMNFELMPDMTHTAPTRCAETLWSRTDLKPADVDTAQLYDGFSVITFQWLEALGLCEPGQAGPFVATGNTRLGGSLPLNTDGGACNVGRRHGANFCIEATRQLRGQCGDRQVDGAEVAVWSNAVGPFAGAMLLTKR